MGRLTAISTVGSVLGVVLIGYVLIPHLPNSITMLITAGILIAWSLLSYRGARARRWWLLPWAMRDFWH